MRHRKAGVKLGRTGSHRNAMFRNMVTSLLKHDRIQTTDTKAKELRRWVDHVITLAKRGDLHARRQALSIVRDKAVVHKLFDNAQELFGSRPGGYSRLIKLGRRAGDAAPMTMVELIIPEGKSADKKKKAKAAEQEASVSPKSDSGVDVSASSAKPSEVAVEKSADTAETASSPGAGTGAREE
ncbi:MAG: 50S ribosomal protein L17 [Thermodesulfobacteriota bacterium]